MFLYALADSVYRKLGCNLSASRRRASFKLWWNDIVRRDLFVMKGVTSFDEVTGEPVFTDYTEFHQNMAIANAVNNYANQTDGQKNMINASWQAYFGYKLLESGYLNPAWRVILVLWDLVIAQPMIFLWDLCMLIVVVLERKAGADVWDEQIEKERTVVVDRLSKMSLSEITKAPVWRRW